MIEPLDENEKILIERLYNDYAKRVKKLAVLILHSEEYADDIVNDTFMKIIRYKDKFINATENERIRLIIIYTRSVCFNFYNRNKKFSFDSLESFYNDENGRNTGVDIPDDFDLLKKLVEEETADYLKKAVENLKEPAKDMILLKFYFEMKNTEIAELYNMNTSTVGTIIQRSMWYLRDELEGYIYGTDK